jgi:cytoplasmic iron level regulating protein YaaA (DUF328/UPF0246 family)
MLILLSPAKSLDLDSPATLTSATQPEFIAQAAQLVAQLKEFSPPQLAQLMGISDALATLNVARYASWSTQFSATNAKQAVLTFNGDVYEGLNAPSLSEKQLFWAQDHVRILSGLYGVLRPLDYLQPYRLEMGTRLANPNGKDLYAFWGGQITAKLNEVLASFSGKSKVLINCASDEYFKAVQVRNLEAPVITPVFEDWKGRWNVVSFYAKRARGFMARYVVTHNITQPEKLKDFDAEGYEFDSQASDSFTWRFRRHQAPN